MKLYIDILSICFFLVYIFFFIDIYFLPMIWEDPLSRLWNNFQDYNKSIVSVIMFSEYNNTVAIVSVVPMFSVP